jgi:hypothetical protein
LIRPSGVLVYAEDLLGPQRLDVTLEPADVASPVVLFFTVVNPEPGGGQSQTLQLTVDEVDETVETPAEEKTAASRSSGLVADAVDARARPLLELV